MFNFNSGNRRKHWYSLLTLGRNKLALLAVLAGVLGIFVLTVLGIYSYRAMEYDLNELRIHRTESLLYDAENRPVAALHDDAAMPVTWEQLPRHLINAFVAREDENFFTHGGIVWSSVLRSIWRNATALKYEQGASTITMQLTRNVFNLQGKNMDRKMLEALLAQRIERNFDKQTIFTEYLNRIYFGCNCYGISAAAHYYFGKPVQQLDLVESAVLAGIVRGPSIYNPVVDKKRAETVKNEVLTRMTENGMLEEKEAAAARETPITLRAEGKGGSAAMECSYATMWAHRELEALQGELEDGSAGVSVVSNILLPLQQYVETAAETAAAAVEMKCRLPEEWEPFLSKEKEVAEVQRKFFLAARRPAGLKARNESNDLKGLLQCCVLVVDARNGSRGNVLAVVGGRSAQDGVDRWQRRFVPGRAASPLLFCAACQPGSSNYIVVDDPVQTGTHVGYSVVKAFYESLGLDAELPPAERENDLYNGKFSVKAVDLARLLFDIQNRGRGYRLSFLRSIWNRRGSMVYAAPQEKAPEYIRRESASSVADMAPFISEEGKPVKMSVTLEENSGIWTMIFRDKAAAVFVWMGFDDNNPLLEDRSLRNLAIRASDFMAQDVLAKTRELMKKEQ